MKQAAFITGSSRGIGKGIALALAKRGFHIALNSTSNSKVLQETQAEIAQLGVSVTSVIGDVAKIAEHATMLAQAEEAIGSLTTLVNNAGISVHSRGDILDVSEESYDACMAVNAKAQFFLSQQFAKRLLTRERDDDRFYSLVHITSANAQAVSVNRAEYCASKAAAAMISQAFSVRLGCEQIAVYDVRPGLIKTDMTAPAIAGYQQRAQDGLTLFPRVGSATEMGEVVASLADGSLPYTTGQVIYADGGLLVARF